MSRVTRRAGTKALVCTICQRGKGNNARTAVSFRGKGKHRLEEHIREAHGRK